MKVLLAALNAKYVHTNLAILYLKAAAPEYNIVLQEFTINEAEEFILSSIYQEKADIVAFSCYIWNIEKILELCSALKKVQPKLKIILGGPEVSYEVEELLRKNSFVDFIIIGEGELTFKQLLAYLAGAEVSLYDIQSLAFREGKEVLVNRKNEGCFDWTSMPSPFAVNQLEGYYEGRSLYYETSRGCPFTCSYCLSGHQGKPVRFLPLERVKRELTIIANSGAKQIKFVDRTFNCNRQRALEIWQYILDLGEGINYHFEISADLLDEDILAFLKKVPEGLFNFEIGIQTTQNDTMEAIYRKSNLAKAFPLIKRLLQETKVMVYVDLIVGLPYETYERFKESFDQVLSLNPHKLHMGFLKILKGSQIKEEVNLHGYRYYDKPPYEILENNFLTFGEIIVLKRIEELLERYYNSQKFTKSHQFLLQSTYQSPFEFYNDLSAFWLARGLFAKAVGLNECYEQLYTFVIKKEPALLDKFREILKFDYLLSNLKGNLPSWYGYYYTKEDKERHAQLVNHPLIIKKYLPHLKDLTRKERINLTHSDYFAVDISDHYFPEKQILVLFDYSKKGNMSNCYLVIPEEIGLIVENSANN